VYTPYYVLLLFQTEKKQHTEQNAVIACAYIVFKNTVRALKLLVTLV